MSVFEHRVPLASVDSPEGAVDAINGFRRAMAADHRIMAMSWHSRPSVFSASEAEIVGNEVVLRMAWRNHSDRDRALTWRHLFDLVRSAAT